MEADVTTTQTLAQQFAHAYDINDFDTAYEIFTRMSRDERAQHLRLGQHFDMLRWRDMTKSQREKALARLNKSC